MSDQSDFIEDLKALIDAKRSFGGHPLWLAILDGQVPRDRLGLFAIQFFQPVREFPRAVIPVPSTCADPADPPRKLHEGYAADIYFAEIEVA